MPRPGRASAVDRAHVGVAVTDDGVAGDGVGEGAEVLGGQLDVGGGGVSTVDHPLAAGAAPVAGLLSRKIRGLVIPGRDGPRN